MAQLIFRTDTRFAGRPDRATATLACRPLHERIHRRQHDQRGASVAAARPPITARPSGAVASAPSPKSERHRHHAGDHRRAGHQHRPHARPGRLDGRLQRRARPARRACSANVTSRIAFATATPIAMIAPMNDCTFSVVPVSQQHHDDAGQHGRHRRDDDQREPQRLEVRGEQQEDDHDRDDAGPR